METGNRFPSLKRFVIAAVVAAVAVIIASPALITAATLQLPQGVTQEQAYRMYTEQVDSRKSIGQLVNGDVASFDILARRATTSTADLDLRVAYLDGQTRNGVMKLFRAGDKWYFASIEGTGTPSEAPLVKSPDIGVLNTMLSEQSTHSDMASKLVNGTYTKIVVAAPKKGYRSKVIPVTFSGRSGSKAGSVTAVKRMQDGRAQWFIVSFQ